MSPTETLSRPEAPTQTEIEPDESLYVGSVDITPERPEVPVPGPGDVIARRASLRGHLLLSKMHITISH